MSLPRVPQAGAVWFGLSHDGSHLWLAGTGVGGRAERADSCFQIHGSDLGTRIGGQEVPTHGLLGQGSHHPDPSPY